MLSDDELMERVEEAARQVLFPLPQLDRDQSDWNEDMELIRVSGPPDYADQCIELVARAIIQEDARSRRAGERPMRDIAHLWIWRSESQPGIHHIVVIETAGIRYGGQRVLDFKPPPDQRA